MLASSHYLEDLPVPRLLAACFQLGLHWKLSKEQLLRILGPEEQQHTRALALLQVFEMVGDLHHADPVADAWPHIPLGGVLFFGKPPIEVMLSSPEGLLLVRDYLVSLTRS